MGKRIDLTGQRFGRLTVVGEGGRTQGRKSKKWRCVCDCGNESSVVAGNLKNGHTRSCGCLGDEQRARGPVKHGMFGTPEYKSWVGMISRCCNPTTTGYENYGGRGIKVCEKWRGSFQAFFDDMGLKPTKEHSLGRVDNNAGYSPSNCRWEDRFEQGANTRANKRVEIDGVDLTYAQWERKKGFRRGLVNNRIQLGWQPEDAVTRPVKGKMSERGD